MLEIIEGVRRHLLEGREEGGFPRHSPYTCVILERASDERRIADAVLQRGKVIIGNAR